MTASNEKILTAFFGLKQEFQLLYFVTKKELMMSRVVLVLLGLSLSATGALAQSVEKPPEKPIPSVNSATAPSPTKSRILNNDVKREELTKKLEFRKQELHQCQHKDRAAGDQHQRSDAHKKE